MNNEESKLPAQQVKEEEKTDSSWEELVDICSQIVTKTKRPKKRTEKSHQKTLKNVLITKEIMKDVALMVKYKKRKLISDYSEVQFITHCTEQYSYLDSARMALEGGCRWIQLRMKDASIDEIYPIAVEVRELCTKYDAIFIIDDHVKLVKKVQADGVHLGKTDMPVEEARKILGLSFIVGGTANTYEDIKKLNKAGADYIGCGPFRYTTTKKNLSPILGLDGYKEIRQKMEARKIDIPVIAIGGITIEDIPAIMQTGVDGIALSGTVLRAENPVEEMKKILLLTSDQ